MLEAALRESDLDVSLQHGVVGPTGLAAPWIPRCCRSDFGDRGTSALPIANGRMLCPRLRSPPAPLDILPCSSITNACGDLLDLLAPDVLRIAERLIDALDSPCGVHGADRDGLHDLGAGRVAPGGISVLQEALHA